MSHSGKKSAVVAAALMIATAELAEAGSHAPAEQEVTPSQSPMTLSSSPNYTLDKRALCVNSAKALRTALAYNEKTNPPKSGAAWHYHKDALKPLKELILNSDTHDSSNPGSCAPNIYDVLKNPQYAQNVTHPHVSEIFNSTKNSTELWILQKQISQQNFENPDLQKIADQVSSRWKYEEALKAIPPYLKDHPQDKDQINQFLYAISLVDRPHIQKALEHTRAELATQHIQKTPEARPAPEKPLSEDIKTPAADSKLVQYVMYYPPGFYKFLGVLPDDAVCLSERGGLKTRWDCFSKTDEPRWDSKFKFIYTGVEAESLERFVMPRDVKSPSPKP